MNCTLNCKGRLIDLSMPGVMGIINLTPDSFYKGSRTGSEKALLALAGKMLAEGADFLDIGGYSSRPGAEHVSEEEELRRVLPAIEAITKNFPEAVISVDTFRSGVAKKAVAAGAALVNDISAGLLDEKMIPTVAKLSVPYVMMHMKGTPQTMRDKAQYEDVTREVIHYFSERIAAARQAGINDIVIDPGFGFAKTVDQNFELLSRLELLQSLEVPVLAGLSRKSMIYKTLQVTPEQALNGTTSLHTVALLKGASILRVHDVGEAVECVHLVAELQR